MSVNLAAPSGFSASNLVFSDSFSGSSLNTKSWNTYMTSNAAQGWPWFDNGSGGSAMGGGGSYDAEYDMPSQVAVNNGLTLTAVQQSITAGGVTYPFTSGVLTTYGKMEFTGGYLQISMKQPSGDGAWPALWMLPGSGAGSSGDNFEIDMQEGGMTAGSANPNDVFSYHLHGSGGTFGGDVNTGVDLSAGFNTYGMNWIPGQSITFYLNGQQVGQITSAQTTIPDEPMELIMSNEVANSVASGWHTTRDGSTPNSMPMQIADVQLYQTPGSGETIMGSNVTGGGSTGAVKPTVAITSTGGTVTPIAQTVAGTVDLADAGSTVKVFDGTTQIGSATAASNGGWTANVTLAHLGANVVTATDTNAAGTGTSNSVTYTVARPLAPTISIANPNLSVTEGGGTVALGIKATANTLQSSTIVTIQGLPSYETITDKLDHLTFQGNLINLTGMEVDSGLTLTSNYQGTGHPSATLTITGNSFVNGVSSAMSAPKTIVVTDPPATANDPSSTLAAMLSAAKTAGTDFAGRWGERPNALADIAGPFLSDRKVGIHSSGVSHSDTGLFGSLAAASGFRGHFAFHS